MFLHVIAEICAFTFEGGWEKNTNCSQNFRNGTS